MLSLSKLPRNSKVELTHDKFGFSIQVYVTMKDGRRFSKLLTPTQNQVDDPSYLGEVVEALLFDCEKQAELLSYTNP